MKKYGDAGLEGMPGPVQQVVLEAEEANAAYVDAVEAGEDSVTIGMLKMIADQKKIMLREQRRYWREVGEATGTRRGIAIENNTGGEE